MMLTWIEPHGCVEFVAPSARSRPGKGCDELEGRIFVGKIDAARRQIETAIWLRFNNGDPVSIHTLCCAGYAILRVLNELVGGEMMLKDLWRMLEGEDRETFLKFINRPDNEFKHAERNPLAIAELDTRWTDALLREAAQVYYKLADESCPPLMSLYVTWHGVHYRTLSPELEAVFDGIDLTGVPDNAHAFFTTFAPWYMRDGSWRQLPR
jgi:hypothetical protein